MSAYLKYLGKERQEQINNQGLVITKILFEKILRSIEVRLSYKVPMEAYRFYRKYRRYRPYPRTAFDLYADTFSEFK